MLLRLVIYVAASYTNCCMLYFFVFIHVMKSYNFVIDTIYANDKY